MKIMYNPSKNEQCATIQVLKDNQAVRVDNTIYVSGSLGLDPKTGELKEGIKEQAHQSLKNIGEILKAAGVGYGNGMLLFIIA
ncbi:endoribonuclease L-PSP [Cooperia oncophora]